MASYKDNYKYSEQATHTSKYPLDPVADIWFSIKEKRKQKRQAIDRIETINKTKKALCIKF